MTDSMWTNEQKIEALLRLPWTVQLTKNSEDGTLAMRDKELPAALAVATNPTELEAEFWESLRETLSVFLEHGDTVPLPALVKQYPWESPENLRYVPGQIRDETAAAFIASKQRSFAHA